MKKKNNPWTPVKTNLWRHTNGNYYAIVKIKGRRIPRSLDTDLRVLADKRLPKKLAEIRAGEGAIKGATLTLGQAAASYLQRKKERGYRRRNQRGVEQSKSRPLKERSLDYRNETVAAWRKWWDGFDDELIALISEQKIHAKGDLVRGKYGPTRFNGMIQTLRGMFDIAVESGACDRNLAMDISFVEVKPSDKPIPTREQVTELLRLLDGHHKRKYSRLSLRLAMFTGIRPNEARHLTKEDINLEAGTLTARETKNGKPRTIQLIPQAMELFREEGIGPVLTAARKNPRRTMMTLSRLLKLEMTPYTMRHLHMSVLLESGVDLPTVALIAGHQDRGVTLAKHYAHVRGAHLKKQLEKIQI
jgi:integrase